MDFFAGIGGFRRGMELAGHKCVGFCEWDPFPVMSYKSMHLITDKQREYLMSLPFKERQKEIKKEEYFNGEWYSNDVRTVDAGSVPRADVWCFGFPCQDISIAGKQLGFDGKRSSLFFTVTRIIRDTREEDRPTTLFIENVKNLLSVNGGIDFLKLLIELDEIGYDAEWQVLNSKDFGVPQNRERVFIVGHLRGRSRREVFPIPSSNGQTCIEVIGNTSNTGHGGENVYSENGIIPTLKARDYKDPMRIAIPVLTPDRLEKRQNGRRFKEDGEDMFTLTAQDRHGISNGCSIRKLTPKECFRLQGWEDTYYERAAMVNSDSQLYKEAGNGVTVTVIQAIAERL